MAKQEKEYQRLTVEEVRKYKGFENRTDEEIRKIIIALEKLSILIYKKFIKEESNHNDYEQIS
jgi:hypothetical protein